MKSGTDLRHTSVWIVRLAWIALALVPGPLGDALGDSGRTAQVTFTVAAWVLWALGVAGISWLSPVSLTTVRCVTPVALVGLVVATLARPNPSESAVLLPLVSIALAVIASLGAFLPDYAAAHVQASAYGAERRLPLRVPIPQIAPMVLTWLLSTAMVTATLFAVGAEVWWLAIVLGTLAVALVWLAATRLHRFSRRWLVVVPAGVVVHDHVLLAETFMVKANSVTSVRPADVPGEALDLSGVARGKLVVVTLRDAEDLALSPFLAKMLGTLDAVHVRGYAVAPTLTGQALAALTKPPATT
jgi:hypothetical protein